MINFRKSIILVLFLSIFAFSTQAQSRRTRQTREEYIDRYKEIAIRDMEKYGIPASITLAQGILESDCGNSRLALASNNHFGIKCKSNWKGKKVYHDDDAKDECFRSYDSVEDSYRDHAEFLDNSPRYDALFSYEPTDYKRWAHGLKAAGYATAPDYAQRLIRIIEESQLYLLDRKGGDRLYASRHRNKKVQPLISPNPVSTFPAGTTIDPDNYRVTINAHKGYNVHAVNGVHYVLAKEGDTFEQIGKAFRISAKNLRKFNDLTDPKARPMTGEPIFIGRKKKRWEGNAVHHTCRAGETVYAVGQLYAIRSRSIAKMNRLKTGTPLTEGMEIRIR